MGGLLLLYPHYTIPISLIQQYRGYIEVETVTAEQLKASTRQVLREDGPGHAIQRVTLSDLLHVSG